MNLAFGELLKAAGYKYVDGGKAGPFFHKELPSGKFVAAGTIEGPGADVYLSEANYENGVYDGVVNVEAASEAELIKVLANFN